MPARRPLGASTTLVRPLLEVSRLDVRAFLAELGQPYRDDPTNADLSRTRARIRHDLLPRLADDYNPNVAEALVRLGMLAASSNRGARRRLRDLEASVTLPADHDEIRLDRETLAQLPRYLRTEFLRLAWRRAEWPERHMSAERWGRLASLARTTREGTVVIAGIEVTTGPKLLVLKRPATPLDRASPPKPFPLEIPGVVPWGNGRIIATLDPDAPRDETVDRDLLLAPLCVRAPSPGDRFAPLGMHGQTTPLNDFLRGRRVPLERRRDIPLVCDRSGIVWVVGHRIADRVRMTPATVHTAGLRWEVDRGALPG